MRGRLPGVVVGVVEAVGAAVMGGSAPAQPAGPRRRRARA
jgi:hypothetical protein